MTGHFWHVRTMNPSMKRPISYTAASVIRCAAAELRTDDRICRSTASTGLAALVKLRIEWIPVKTLCN